jgi:hypothetical protein
VIVGFRFRQRLKVIPGVYLNVSSRGMSVSLGGSGATVNVSRHGTRLTVSVPGTGISYQTRLSGEHPPVPPPIDRKAESEVPHANPAATPPGFNPVASAPIDTLAQEGATELRDMIRNAYLERRELEQECDRLQRVADDAQRRFSWLDNWFFKRLLKKMHARRGEAFRIAVDEALDAKQALSDYGVKIEWSLEPGIAEIYDSLISRLHTASLAFKAWRTVSIRHLGYRERIVERTISGSTIQRERIRLGLSRPAYLPATPGERWAEVPTMGKADGSKIYVFPSFLVFESGADFAVLEPQSLTIDTYITRFIETEGVPGDARIVGNTWRYTNKNGTPDRRYSVNPAVPIAEYGAVNVSSTHVDEQFMFSNAEAAVAFGQALQHYCQWYGQHATPEDGPMKSNQAVANQLPPPQAGKNPGWVLGTCENNAAGFARTFSDALGERFKVLVSMEIDASVWITVEPRRDGEALSLQLVPDPAALVLDGQTVVSCATLMGDYESQQEEKTYPPVQRHDNALSFQIVPSASQGGAELRFLALFRAGQVGLRITLASDERCTVDLGIDNFSDMISRLIERCRANVQKKVHVD